MPLDRPALEAWAAAHRSEIESYHKSPELVFTALAVDPTEVPNLPGVLVYKSPRPSARQSSHYFLAEIDEQIVWVRVADHWGRFTVYRPDLGRDVPYNWTLRHVQADAAGPGKRLRVGYVPVSCILDVQGDEPGEESSG